MTRPRFTHAGVYTRDLEVMVAFYKHVLRLVETDRGIGVTVPRMLVFLSSDPDHHHQFVLSDGRGANDPSTVNQLSFQVSSIEDLRTIEARARAHGIVQVTRVNHGNALSIYFLDPEGNMIEIYVETPWYISQPHAHLLDLTRSDEEILRETESRCRQDSGFMPIVEWRARMRAMLSPQ